MECKLCELLRKARESYGITATELARRLGIGRSEITRYEHGKRQISFKALVEIAEVLQANEHLFINAWLQNYLLIHGFDKYTVNLTKEESHDQPTK
ncbi:MAG: helix-turn-helix transcriptional regulator [Alphaproteobacteria bacterium]|nr:helix-turn-helix transcriptional regulator [Alphaproteobacteria bacterium]